MKNIKFLGSVLLGFACSQPAFATHCHQIDRFWVSLNFPSRLLQTPVSSIFASVGLKRSTRFPDQSTANPSELEEGRMVTLVESADHYFSKTKLISKAGECVDDVVPSVEFIILYKNGLVTHVGEVTIEESNASEDENDRTFELIKDAASTKATHLKTQTAS